MLVKELNQILERHGEASLHFMLPSGEFVPDHFHVTEVGRVEKNFIDCGGTRRVTASCLLQLWTAQDVGHRLAADKLSKIMTLAAPILESDDLAVDVEYGPDIASQYSIANIEVTPKRFVIVLAGRQTACLASDRCGVAECGTAGCC